MQAIGSMFRRTTHHVRRQREIFALRARKAGASFAQETRHASKDLATAVRGEADAWGKYVRNAASEVTGAVTPRTLQRSLLSRVSGMLRALDERVSVALRSLERPRRARRTKAARLKRQAVSH
jgi:hypothetical protein